MNRGIRPEFNEKLIKLFENELHEVRREDSLKIVKLQQEIENLKLIIKSKDEEILRLKNDQPQPQPQLQPQQMLKPLLPGIKLENENGNGNSLSFNKYSKHPSLTVSPIKRNQSIKNSKFVKPNNNNNNNNNNDPTCNIDKRFVKSMYDNIHLIPTQYSDDDDDEKEEDIGVQTDQDNENNDDDGNDHENKFKISPIKLKVQFSSQGSNTISPKRKYSDYETTMNLSKNSSPIKKIPKLTKSNYESLTPTQCLSSSIVNLSQQEQQQDQQQEQKRKSISVLSPKSTNIPDCSCKNRQQCEHYQNDQIEDKEIVEDSQENSEEIITINNLFPSSASLLSSSFHIEIPENYNTIILQRKYRLQFYINKYYNDVNFKINFRQHPTKLIDWDEVDFILNENYKPDKFIQFLNRNNIKNSKQFEKFKKLYQHSTTTTTTNNNNNELSHLEQFEFEDKLSQIFDKFQSPPGFMQSEFPNTQEYNHRQEIIKQRQLKRIKRRIKDCIMIQDDKQIGEFVFAIEIFNLYVISNRWYIK